MQVIIVVEAALSRLELWRRLHGIVSWGIGADRLMSRPVRGNHGGCLLDPVVNGMRDCRLSDGKEEINNSEETQED